MPTTEQQCWTRAIVNAAEQSTGLFMPKSPRDGPIPPALLKEIRRRHQEKLKAKGCNKPLKKVIFQIGMGNKGINFPEKTNLISTF